MLSSILAIMQSEQKAHYFTGVADPSVGKVASLSSSYVLPNFISPVSTIAKIATTEMHELFDGDIWVIPYAHNHDFEIITMPLEYSFTIYNSGKTSSTLNALYATSAEGTNVEGVGVPYVFKANAQRTFTIKASMAGDRILDGNYTFVFDNQTILFSIKGARAVVLSIMPTRYVESEKFETNIFTSQDGTESRISNIDTPKRFIEYDVVPNKNQKIEMLQEVITYALQFSCLQPLWFSYTQATITQEAYTIFCDTKNRDFKINDYALIRKEYNDYTMLKIKDLTQTSITFTTQASVTQGDAIIPLMACTPINSGSFTFFNSDVASFSLKLKEIL